MDLSNVVLVLYTDGAYSPKDKCGGWSVVAQTFTDDGFKQYEFSGGEHNTTNNKMELAAVIKALSFAMQFFARKFEPDNMSAFIMSDSSYVVNAVNNMWIEKWKLLHWVKTDGGAVKNKERWVKLDNMLRELTECGVLVKFIHVRGHDGNDYNELADSLAVQARKKVAMSLK